MSHCHRRCCGHSLDILCTGNRRFYEITRRCDMDSAASRPLNRGVNDLHAGFYQWPGSFGDPLPACAGLDRFLHHAEAMVITGTSLRAQRHLQLEQEVLIAQQAAS